MRPVTIPAGVARVYAHCGVGGLLPLRWGDISEAHPQLQGWLDAGLVSLQGPAGEPPPTELPQPCCGGMR